MEETQNGENFNYYYHIMFWVIQYLYWFYWIIHKVKGILSFTEQLMRPGICFYDLDITCAIQIYAISQRLLD